MKFKKLFCFVLIIFLGLTNSFTTFEYFRILRFLAIQGNERRSKFGSRRFWGRVKPANKWSTSNGVNLSSVKPEFWQLCPLCRGEVTDCDADVFCESKLLCKSALTTTPLLCCAPKYRFCPPSRLMGINCNLQKPTNWCITDFDCHTTPTRRCCPTGCNYNICV